MLLSIVIPNYTYLYVSCIRNYFFLSARNLHMFFPQILYDVQVKKPRDGIKKDISPAPSKFTILNTYMVCFRNLFHIFLCLNMLLYLYIVVWSVSLRLFVFFVFLPVPDTWILGYDAYSVLDTCHILWQKCGHFDQLKDHPHWSHIRTCDGKKKKKRWDGSTKGKTRIRRKRHLICFYFKFYC